MKVVLNSRVGVSLARRGVALVITLILLSVITFMAVTFLVVSRAERGSVSTSTDQLHAKLAADTALERAKADLLASIIAFTNQFAFDLLVSTNYVNPLGFVPGNVSPTNVSYTYASGNPVSGVDALQNISNLMYYPRVPVFMTNRLAGRTEFPFYLDLNRNGLYETNGYQAVINPLGTYYDTNGQYLATPVNGLTLSNSLVGDPEWVGGLEFSDRRHAADNRFLWRYAYLVVPEGKTLDINSVHNYARFARGSGAQDMPKAQGDRFFRNQGVGTWEMNLAGFLVDLNTNFWPYPFGTVFGAPYDYRPWDMMQANQGAAFDDSLFLLRYRYQGNIRRGLPSVFQLYGQPGRRAFTTDQLDGYSAGPLMTNSWLQVVVDPDNPNMNWPGANNTNHFFTTQDLFARSKIAGNQYYAPNELTFVDRMTIAGTNVSTYDRYTFYRFLSQMGTDSGAEPDTRINVNYDNKVQRSNGVARVENYIPWRAEDFFREAADRLLQEGAPRMAGNASLSVTNIPLSPTNYYSASVHRMLQVAANIHDATTNRSIVPNDPLTRLGLPSVFRPLFNKVGTNVTIVGYEQVRDLQSLTNGGMRMRDLDDPSDMVQSWGPRDMVYGIPLVVGAKKGYPNFNEFAMQSWVDVTRKLEFRRPSLTLRPNETNQMYIVGLSNVFGVEAWNSYTNTFARPLGVQVAADITLLFSNEFGILITNRFSRGFATNLPANTWKGFMTGGALQVPLSNLVTFLPASVYRNASRNFVPLTSPASTGFERGQGFPIPNWWMTMRSRVRFVLTTPHPDGGGDALLDYVNLAATEGTVNISDTVAQGGSAGISGSPGSQWVTNRVGNSTSLNAPTYGIINQIQVGLGNVDPDSWNDFTRDPTVGNDRQKAIDHFRVQFGLGPMFYPQLNYYKSNVFYAPFIPHRTIYQTTTWQANDPLVHYTVGDLMDMVRTNNVDFITPNPPLPNLGQINTRYEPWGGNPIGQSTSPTKFELAVKDPLVRRSDDWEFPTNKFPNIGWIGRVHRGTPWQTVYLKSPGVDLLTWARWTGNGQTWISGTNEVADAEFTLPEKDRRLVDIFTAALNENATRGQLSVNQTGLAAWSAVLSGNVAVSNNVPDADFARDPFLQPSFQAVIVPPAGAYDPSLPPPVARIVDGINRVRADRTIHTNGVFMKLGDVLSVPELTVGARPTYVGTYPNGYWTGVSPFINLGNPAEMDPNAADIQNRYTTQQRQGLNEAAYERLPQQILGLLRGESQPRFVVYAYGQALKPADRSLVTAGGPFIGLCTNYQITAEMVTRAVVRVEGAPEAPKVIVEQFNVLPPD